MSKLAAAIAVSTLAAAVSVAHADVVEPTQEPEPGATDPAPGAASDSAPTRQPTVGNWSADGELPPLSGGRLLGEAALGTVFALGGGVGGAFVGASIEVRSGCHQDLCGLAGGIVGGAIGLTVVTPVGVYIAGTVGDQTGSLGATFAGSLMGSALGIALAVGTGSDAAAPLLVLGPVLGSMAGFNLTRDYAPWHKQRRRVVVPVASATGERTTFGLAGSF